MILQQILSPDHTCFEIITLAGAQTCSVNAKRYHDVLSRFVIPQHQQRQCLDKIIFMQNGAPPQIGKSAHQLMRHHFTEERVIILCFHVAWPPHSPDLTPCDFFLWGYRRFILVVSQTCQCSA